MKQEREVIEIIHWEDDGTERNVYAFCKICYPEGGWSEIVMLVSPTGVAHHNHYIHSDRTHCGHDATGDQWWWRL